MGAIPERAFEADDEGIFKSSVGRSEYFLYCTAFEIHVFILTSYNCAAGVCGRHLRDHHVDRHQSPLPSSKAVPTTSQPLTIIVEQATESESQLGLGEAAATIDKGNCESNNARVHVELYYPAGGVGPSGDGLPGRRVCL